MGAPAGKIGPLAMASGKINWLKSRSDTQTSLGSGESGSACAGVGLCWVTVDACCPCRLAPCTKGAANTQSRANSRALPRKFEVGHMQEALLDLVGDGETRLRAHDLLLARPTHQIAIDDDLRALDVDLNGLGVKALAAALLAMRLGFREQSHRLPGIKLARRAIQ